MEFPNLGHMGLKNGLISAITCLLVLLLPRVLSSGSDDSEIPQVIFLRRLVRQYTIGGERASITLVFYSKHVVEGGLSSRWFRPAPNQNLPYAELANKLPSEGDDRYTVNTISAGHVVATSLVIKKLKIRSYPQEYSLIVKIKNSPMQYTVTTRIMRDTPYKVEILDGIHWLEVPPPDISFGFNGQFTVTCKVEIDSESSPHHRSLDELHMYRTYLQRDSRKSQSGHLVSINVGAIHKDRDNYVEKSGKYKLIGQRFVRNRMGIVGFELIFRVANATQEDEGMYSCAMERVEDKAYVSTWVRQASLDGKPLVEFIPCEAHNFDKVKEVLNAEAGKETCFRCRGIGYPSPEVGVYRDGVQLMPNPTLLVDRYVNVADGGMAEVTYTFLNPSYEDDGAYECRAMKGHEQASFPFNLAFV